MPPFQKQRAYWQSQALLRPQILLMSDNVWEHPPKALCPDLEQSVLEENQACRNIDIKHLDTAWQLIQSL